MGLRVFLSKRMSLKDRLDIYIYPLSYDSYQTPANTSLAYYFRGNIAPKAASGMINSA